MVVFKGNKSARENKFGLEKFQQIENKAAVNRHILFTVEICITEENSLTPVKEARVQIVMNDVLPLQDMKISWSPEGGLKFGLCLGKRDSN